MIRYALVDEGRRVVSELTVNDLTTLMMNAPEGLEPVPLGDQQITSENWSYLDGEFVEIVPPVPLARRKAEKWAAVKMRRDTAEQGGCVAPLGRVDTDPDSQRKISGAVQMAMIAQAAGQLFEIVWTMQDNSEAVHDAAAMLEMGVAVGTHVAACHAVARALWEQIEAAADDAALEAIDVGAGWPGQI